MNIEKIANQSANRMMDVDKNQYGNHSLEDSRMKTSGVGYSLDITGKVRENAAYGKEELKSAQEIAQAAGVQDVSLQRDYMAVMSNSMSSEDFAQLIKDGVNPTDTSVSESVTSLDKIKIKMAEAGIEINGFNDNLTAEDYESASGNPEVAKAVETAKKLEPMTEETLAFMIQNDLSPTIENIYKAEHSTRKAEGIEKASVTYDGLATYANKNQTDLVWEELSEQAEQIVVEAGLNPSEGMEGAKWLVENQIPLTTDTLSQYVTLTNTDIPTEDKDILKAIDNAIVDGKSPMEADFSKNENIYEEAVRINKDFAKLTLDGDITAKRQLEEVRLQMTSEANLTLLRKGISIDTKNLEKLVDMLKEAEREFYAPLFESSEAVSDDESIRHSDDKTIENSEKIEDGSNIKEPKNPYTKDNELDSKIALYKSSLSIAKEIPQIPLEMVAKVSFDEEKNDYSKDFSLNDLQKAGKALANDYEKAGKSYEALMTTPRQDMGDSIKKAFGNVDDILSDLDIELNDTNRKAVRTLGYANMPINKESIEEIREVSATVQRVVSLMTPKKTLELIREGHNPLEDNIYDLEKELSKESPEEAAVKYSRYLMELERKGDITPEEKSAYIGMFRLFNLIEKQDGRVIGNVLSSGQDLTMKNMLSASRSNRHKNMDIKIDDEFGLLEELVIKDESITEQISKGFTQMLAAPLSKDFTDEKLKDTKKAAKADPEVASILQDISETVSVDNIIALEDMITSFDKGTKKLFGKDKANNKEADENKDKENILTDEDAFTLIDYFTDRSAAKKAYDEYLNKAANIAKEGMEKAESSLDVKEWIMIHKQIGFASSMSRNETYEVPVKTKDGYTSIHLTLKSSGQESGKVEATMETPEYGKITAKFIMTSDGVDGFVVSDSRPGCDNIKSKKADIINELEKEGMKTKDISFVFGRVTKANDFYSSGSENVSNNQLYKLAKAFVIAVSE